MIEKPQSVITIKSDKDEYVRENVPEEALESEETLEEEAEEFIYDDVNKVYSKEAASKDEVVLRFAGDVCFYDDFSLMRVYRERGSDIRNCIDETMLNYMTGADIFMINNEFCYSDRGTPIEGKQYAFRSKPENVSILNDMGVDIVSLANNHAYDWGPDALSDSVDILNKAKVPFVGAGKNIDEAMRPAYFKINGITISYVSATQIERLGNPDTKEATETSAGVLRTLDPEKACRVINEAKKNSDFCVMYVHWGSENTDLVEGSQRELAKKYVEAGADLIIGDHSHCLQGVDYIGDVPVFYSLGNYWFNSKTVDTGVAEIVISCENASKLRAQAASEVTFDIRDDSVGDSEGNNDNGNDNGAENKTDNAADTADNVMRPGRWIPPIKEVRFIPARQINFGTVSTDAVEASRILNYMQGISDYAEIDTATGVITRSDTNHNTQGGMNTSPTRRAPDPDPLNAGIVIDETKGAE